MAKTKTTKKTGKGAAKVNAPAPVIGRPTLYTEELAEVICVSLMAGYSLRKICSLPDMPDKATVFGWLAKKDHPFLDQYARAREIQAENMADELIDIADDKSDDVSGELKMPNAVAVQRSRLQVDARKWVASKLLPKKYGDRVTAEHTGEGGGPVVFKLVRQGAGNRAEVVDGEAA